MTLSLPQRNISDACHIPATLPDHIIILLYRMLGEVAREYLQRFSNLMTESVYASKGLEDYSRMKRYSDYLDYDRLSLFREKGKAEAGLRNIGNTCYLNVILQLLFHVNYLREKVFTTQVKSELVRQVRALFGEMAIGRLAFADPSDLFEQLRVASPQVFVAGVQNDFHEIFTLLIDQLSEGYKESSPEEARFINKLLFGRMATRIDFQEGRTTKSATFNIINLDVVQGSFEKAFDKWQHYKIEGYETPKGTRVTASAQNCFLETPALMAFFINRVTYREGKLQKNSRIFQFQKNIQVSKYQAADKPRPPKSSSVQKQQEHLQERAGLVQWLQRIQAQRLNIAETLRYLQAKEAPLLSEPHVRSFPIRQVDNPLGETALSAAAGYLEKELQAIEVKAEEARREIVVIDEKLKKLEEEGSSETYVLWAVMIHEGTSAVHGHYKVCISINDNWFEYNDRIVRAIPAARIEEYKNKGEICCLFYRRPSLLCDSQRIPVPLSLKTLVGQQQRTTRAEIDKARLLQALYQETESANILLQHQIHYGVHQRFQFFFKPVHFALGERWPTDTCRGIIISETLSSQAFRSGLASRLVSEDAEVVFQRGRFGIPEEYSAIQDILRAFMSKEALVVQAGAAYEELASKRLKFTNKAIRERYFEMLEIIVLKGLYYLKALPEASAIDSLGFNKISNAIDKLLQTMDQSSEFALVTIAIKSSLRVPVGSSRRDRSLIKTITIDNFGEYFSENFRFWIKQRSVLSKLDESNFVKDAPALPIKE